MSGPLYFPKGFFWGSATSAHQVEGGNHNDWTVWETSSQRFEFLRRKGLLEKHGLGNYVSGVACDSYNRFKEDFALAKSLGHNAHRFSVEWSRVEPEMGVFDEDELIHYVEVVNELRSNGLEPFITLWHWTLPTWLSELGGVESKQFPSFFARFVRKVVESLNTVNYWITLNEPMGFAYFSFLEGSRPPQKKSLLSYFRVINNLVNAHKEAYKVIKGFDDSNLVGVAKNNAYFNVVNKFNPLNHVVKRVADWWVNFYFLDRVKSFQDFIGLNFYFTLNVDWWFKPSSHPSLPLPNCIVPINIYHCLKQLSDRYGSPIFITENGVVDASDDYRPNFLVESLVGVHKAISEGVDVRGYFYWSLLDNFEWDYGFSSRFGLVAVDYDNGLKRIPRYSAFVYKSVCENNAISEELINSLLVS